MKRLPPFDALAWLSTLLMCGGCELNLSPVPVYTSRADAAMSAPPAEAGRDVMPSPLDAAHDGAVGAPDAWSRDADSARTKHPACPNPAPEALPEVGVILHDAKGRPAFDFWRDLACADVGPLVECRKDLAPASSWGCAQCLKAIGDAPAVCAPYAAPSALCADEKTSRQPLFYQNGACVTCVPDELKRRLCCDGVEAVDCRAWPFTVGTLSKHHEVCARHEDCEEGLVCRAQVGRGYGVCVCHEDAVDAFASAPQCAGGMP